MKFKPTNIDGVFIIKPIKLQDSRGYFCELFKSSEFKSAIGLDINFVQENFSYSKHRGTVRGLHYQAPPFAQGKLVRCSRGAVKDIAVDVRPNSPTYGKHVSAILSQENGCQIWIPSGFLHGFITLENDSEVAYKVTNYYSGEYEGNVLWNDPQFGIDWGIRHEDVILSDKDQSATLSADWGNPFGGA